MAHTAKPAPRAKARVSGVVVAGRRDSRKSNRTRTEKQVGEIEVYDSLDYIGHLVPKGTGYLAFSASGKFLGARGSSRVAAGLVYEAHRPGRQS